MAGLGPNRFPVLEAGWGVPNEGFEPNKPLNGGAGAALALLESVVASPEVDGVNWNAFLGGAASGVFPSSSVFFSDTFCALPNKLDDWKGLANGVAGFVEDRLAKIDAGPFESADVVVDGAVEVADVAVSSVFFCSFSVFSVWLSGVLFATLPNILVGWKGLWGSAADVLED